MPVIKCWIFLVFRFTSDQFVVVASEAKCGDVRLFSCERGHPAVELSPTRPMPNVRQSYPWPWAKLHPEWRAQIRAIVHAERDDECMVVPFEEAPEHGLLDAVLGES